jgi:hypothetical protein
MGSIHRPKRAGPAMAKQEHGQSLVIFPPFADLFAPVEDGARHAVERATDRRLFKPVHRIIEGGVPCLAERAAGRPAAKTVGGRVRHADAPARLLDARGFGQGLDKGDLFLGGPAVMALAQRNRGEGDQRVFGPVLHRRAYALKRGL